MNWKQSIAIVPAPVSMHPVYADGKTSLLSRWLQVTAMRKKDMTSPMKFISRLKNVFLAISPKRRKTPCSLRVILSQRIRRVLVEAHLLFLGLSGQSAM